MYFFDDITEFIFLQDAPAPSDVIFVPGGNYGGLAVKAAELYRKGMADYVLPSGRYSILTDHFHGPLEGPGADLPDKEYRWETEWDYMKEILSGEGVSDHAILCEKQATYTWENACYSRELLKREEIPVHRAILCCQAFHARRCKLYYQIAFPDTEILVVPVNTQGITRDNWYKTEKGTRTVLGELEKCGSQFTEIYRDWREEHL